MKCRFVGPAEPGEDVQLLVNAVLPPGLCTFK